MTSGVAVRGSRRITLEESEAMSIDLMQQNARLRSLLAADAGVAAIANGLLGESIARAEIAEKLAHELCDFLEDACVPRMYGAPSAEARKHDAIELVNRARNFLPLRKP